METWEWIARRLSSFVFFLLFIVSIGAAVHGIADAMTLTPAIETSIPEEDLVFTKEVLTSGEMVFRFLPVHEVKLVKRVQTNGEIIFWYAPIWWCDSVETPEVAEEEFFFEPEEENETTITIFSQQQPKRFFISSEEESEAEMEPYVQEQQPVAFLQNTGNKVIVQYSGNIDYESVLQGPVIYDFGPEGELALEWVVWHEARGEPFDGQVAVAASAINRLYSNCPWFDDKSSIIGVLSEPYQFAYLEVSDADLAACPNVSRAVQAAIRGADPTVCEAFPDGAMWYYNPAGTDQTFSEADYELVIGHHHFHNYGYKWKR